MLFNDRLLFVHVPKTAGVSITKFLIDNLPGPMTLTEPSGATDPSFCLPLRVRMRLRARDLMKRCGMWYPRRVRVAEGRTHERLVEAQQTLARFGRRLEDFEVILAVIRNPYDMEVSRYHFLRQGYHGVSGVARGRDQKSAMEQDFERFALSARSDGRLSARIEDWYELDGRIPDNLRLLRFESLEGELEQVFGEFYPVSTRLTRVNTSAHAPYTSYLTSQAEVAIFRKYQWLFDRGFYTREIVSPEQSGAV